MKKVHRNLFFRGNREHLKKFIQRISHYSSDKWNYYVGNDILKQYLLFRFSNNDSSLNAQLSIFYGESSLKNEELEVGNIVPLNKDQLTIDEYNYILLDFYENIVKKYIAEGSDIEIEGPTTDVFNLKQVMSEKVYSAFMLFCEASSGLGESDELNSTEERMWYSFVYNSFLLKERQDKNVLVYAMTDDLTWLQKNNKPMMEKKAEALAHRYELEYDILQYFEERKRL